MKNRYLYVVLAVSMTANCLLFWRLTNNGRTFESQLVAPDQVELIRTKGGLLQVSTLKATETFNSSKDHQIFGLISIGQTATQIRVPAVFHYHIALAPEWRVTVRGNTFIVIAPSVMPTLPVAINTDQLQFFSSGTWSFFTGRTELDALQKSITKTLEGKASSATYIQYQRETARKTVGEFVEKWLMTQEGWKDKGPFIVKVFFADESIGSLSSLP
jgi:hypothetical protein